jgi:ribosomal protein S19
VWPKKAGDKVPPVRTQARSATILPNFVGLNFEIHNGKDYLPVAITEDMVGHKLGEFAPYVFRMRKRGL